MKSTAASESLHYTGWITARAGVAAGAVMRGGGWDGRSSLSRFTRSCWSAFSVAAQDQPAAVGGREVDVEHLDGSDRGRR